MSFLGCLNFNPNPAAGRLSLLWPGCQSFISDMAEMDFFWGEKKAACRWKSTFQELHTQCCLQVPQCTARARPPQLLELHIPFRSPSCSALQKSSILWILGREKVELHDGAVSHSGCLNTTLMYYEGRFSTEIMAVLNLKIVIPAIHSLQESLPAAQVPYWNVTYIDASGSVVSH